MLVYSNTSFRILGYMDPDFQGYFDYSKFAYEENLADSFTKNLLEPMFEKRVNCMSLRNVSSLL